MKLGVVVVPIEPSVNIRKAHEIFSELLKLSFGGSISIHYAKHDFNIDAQIDMRLKEIMLRFG